MKAALINTTDDLGHHGCTLVNRQIRQFTQKAGIELTVGLPLHGDWDQTLPAGLVAVIVNGEGTLHGCSKGARRIAEVPAWAARKGLRSFLINTVYQANSAEIAAGVEGFEKIFVRDELSFGAIKEAGIAASVVPDLSLTWQPPPVHSLGPELIINGSTSRQIRGRFYDLSRSQGRYLPILAKPLGNANRLAKYRRKQVLANFVPPSLWRARLRNAIPDFDDFISHLRARAGAIVTGRFHMATIALSLEIPVLAVRSNTHKMEALFGALDMTERLVTLEELALDEITVPAFSAEELHRIREYKREAVTKASACFEAIAESI